MNNFDNKYPKTTIVKRKKVFKIFIKFLKEEKIFHNFFTELNSNHAKEHRKSWDFQVDPFKYLSNELYTEYGYAFIRRAFLWSSTKHGDFFWGRKNEKWELIHRKICKEL